MGFCLALCDLEDGSVVTILLLFPFIHILACQRPAGSREKFKVNNLLVWGFF